jgi:deazaflavin-dependent oxidoreductase (nitroreductase family)
MRLKEEQSMTRRSLKFDCCIAGGGPAGMMLGYLLARSGVNVAVLEKWPDFLRDFRGDTIHPSTMEVLHELDLLKDFLELPHDRTTKVTAMVGGTPVTVAGLSLLNIRTPYVAFTPQWHFLNFLAETGKRLPHFHLMMETEVTDIIAESGQVRGVRANTPNGTVEIRADLVVGADGRDSTVRERAGLQVENKGAPVDVLWFRLSKHPDDSGHPFGVIGEGKLLVMIDRGDYWQCAFNIVKGDFDRIKDQGLQSFKQQIVRLAPFIDQSIDELTEWDQVRLLRVTVDRLKTWHRPGLVCIGDAAHAMSPMGGVGINLAIQDAVAAANILISGFAKDTPTAGDLVRIQKRRELPTRVTQGFQVLMQDRVLLPYLRSGKPAKAPWALRLFNWLPFLRWLPARFIAVGVRPEHVHRVIRPKPTIPWIIRALHPLAHQLLEMGVPIGPDKLITIRGRKTGKPRTTGVAVIEIDNRRWVMGSYGDVNWTRNLRKAGEATIQAGKQTERVTARELDIDEAATFFREDFKRYTQTLPRMVRIWVPKEILEHPNAAARTRPVFEIQNSPS